MGVKSLQIFVPKPGGQPTSHFRVLLMDFMGLCKWRASRMATLRADHFSACELARATSLTRIAWRRMDRVPRSTLRGSVCCSM